MFLRNNQIPALKFESDESGRSRKIKAEAHRAGGGGGGDSARGGGGERRVRRSPRTAAGTTAATTQQRARRFRNQISSGCEHKAPIKSNSAILTSSTSPNNSNLTSIKASQQTLNQNNTSPTSPLAASNKQRLNYSGPPSSLTSVPATNASRGYKASHRDSLHSSNGYNAVATDEHRQVNSNHAYKTGNSLTKPRSNHLGYRNVRPRPTFTSPPTTNGSCGGASGTSGNSSPASCISSSRLQKPRSKNSPGGRTSVQKTQPGDVSSRPRSCSNSSWSSSSSSSDSGNNENLANGTSSLTVSSLLRSTTPGTPNTQRGSSSGNSSPRGGSSSLGVTAAAAATSSPGASRHLRTTRSRNRMTMGQKTSSGLKTAGRSGAAESGASTQNRFTRELAMAQDLVRPKRLDMLLDMPPASREVAVKHSWDPDDRSLNIFVKDDDKTTFHRHPVAQSTDCIRSRTGYTRGIHYWEMTWSTRQRGTHAVVGVATPEAPLHSVGYQSLVGSNDQSWGWDLGRNKLHHNSKGGNSGITYPKLLNCDETFAVPDKFIIILDMEEGTLSFMVDGQYLGVAFRGLRGKRLHLIVSAVWGHCEITLRYLGGLGPDPLPLMDLARRAVRLSVGKQRLHRLQELNLPSSVIDYLHFKDRDT
ncbi:mucin-5AC isoform X2 [Hyalella azteca]|uniref:Mucin-5AC isoform X2 n=1 Tax=Hyalella azteca TaxID=294128 RepID=A0A979FRL9_HYAAZ|nr:mucin-5AC isoform X2 [Hyalella azteca]